MRMIRWSEICPDGEALHVAYVEHSEAGSWALHGHDYCEVFWVDSGRGVHLLGRNANPVPLIAGQLVFIRAADIHGFRAEASTEPFALINVAFSRKAWNQLRTRYQLNHLPMFDERAAAPPVQELVGETRAAISRQFRELLTEKRTPRVRDGFLLSLARQCSSDLPPAGVASAPAWLRKGLLGSLQDPDFLREGAPRLASLSGCSMGHLARTMRQTLGVTPSGWVMNARLRRASQLLEATGFSVADVALEAGFENLSHFHRCFRAAFGATPLVYRKERSRAVM